MHGAQSNGTTRFIDTTTGDGGGLERALENKEVSGLFQVAEVPKYLPTYLPT